MQRTAALLVVTLGFLACSPSEEDIREEIAGANTCSTVVDCVNLGSHCPFGCAVVVNRTEADRIREMLTDFESSGGQQCLYGCMPIKEITCEHNRCAAEFEGPEG